MSLQPTMSSQGMRTSDTTIQTHIHLRCPYNLQCSHEAWRRLTQLYKHTHTPKMSLQPTMYSHSSELSPKMSLQPTMSSHGSELSPKMSLQPTMSSQGRDMSDTTVQTTRTRQCPHKAWRCQTQPIKHAYTYKQQYKVSEKTAFLFWNALIRRNQYVWQWRVCVCVWRLGVRGVCASVQAPENRAHHCYSVYLRDLQAGKPNFLSASQMQL